MRILVSACLLGENCKYSGGNNFNQRVLEFVRGHEVVPVCPELLGGMGVPRPPVEIVAGKVRRADGTSVDAEYRRGVEAALAVARRAGVELAVLQSRSPTCGVNEIYDGTFSGTRVRGQGLFAEALSAAGIRIIDAEEV